jgi:hypothetical protein
MKSKGINQTEFLALLQKVLPKATKDPHLASKIYEQVAQEVRLINSIESFEKFCEEGGLPNLEPQTVSELQQDLAGKFGEGNVAITADEEGGGVAVEIALPDRKLSTRVKVQAPGEDPEAAKVPFVPFPVALPEDPELVWVLARREDLGPDEAARALASIEEEFWATKGGQKLQREGTEKSFADFIQNVPAAALADSGLKRHYKQPETLHALHLLHHKSPAEELGAALT